MMYKQFIEFICNPVLSIIDMIVIFYIIIPLTMVSPWFVLLIFPMAIISYWIQKHYIER